jgi:hypothetical protein
MFSSAKSNYLVIYSILVSNSPIYLLFMLLNKEDISDYKPDNMSDY